MAVFVCVFLGWAILFIMLVSYSVKKTNQGMTLFKGERKYIHSRTHSLCASVPWEMSIWCLLKVFLSMKNSFHQGRCRISSSMRMFVQHLQWEPRPASRLSGQFVELSCITVGFERIFIREGNMQSVCLIDTPAKSLSNCKVLLSMCYWLAGAECPAFSVMFRVQRDVVLLKFNLAPGQAVIERNWERVGGRQVGWTLMLSAPWPWDVFALCQSIIS